MHKHRRKARDESPLGVAVFVVFLLASFGIKAYGALTDTQPQVVIARR